MTQNDTTNRRIVLASRPEGAPTPENFRLEETAIPTPAAGQVLLRTLTLSLDPYMRGRMSDAASYADPVDIGAVMVGGTVCRVEASENPDFAAGDLVVAQNGWQDYALSDGQGVQKLHGAVPRPSLALGVLGMPGFTAYSGLLDIGRPVAGETVAVAAASGAVGSVVGQIAKLRGCRAVGIAGGPEKCRYVVEELGFDACIDHRDADLKAQLAEACPGGIDVYFENVGGRVFDAVLPLLNAKARVPVCGLIANYNATELPAGPDRTPLLMRALLVKRIRMQGFIIFEDYGDNYGAFFKDMSAWLADGRVKFREDIVDGLENAPNAFMGLLQGKNFGKLVIKSRRLKRPRCPFTSGDFKGTVCGVADQPRVSALTDRALSLQNATTLGFLVALAAAVTISVTNVLVPMVYAVGSNAATLVVLRFGFFLVVCGLWLKWQSITFTLTRAQLKHCAGAGLFYAVGSGALITAFGLMPVSLVILIFYTYPLLTRLIECALDRRLPTLFELACLLAALAGLGLCLGVGLRQLNGPGLAFSSLAALAITGAFLWSGRRLRAVEPPVQTFYMAGMGLIAALAYTVATASWAPPPLETFAISVKAAAVITSAAAFLAMFAGVRMIGASRTAMVMNLEPVLTVALAIALLEETLTTHQFFGAILVVAAVAVAQTRHVSVARTVAD